MGLRRTWIVLAALSVAVSRATGLACYSCKGLDECSDPYSPPSEHLIDCGTGLPVNTPASRGSPHPGPLRSSSRSTLLNTTALAFPARKGSMRSSGEPSCMKCVIGGLQDEGPTTWRFCSKRDVAGVPACTFLAYGHHFSPTGQRVQFCALCDTDGCNAGRPAAAAPGLGLLLATLTPLLASR